MANALPKYKITPAEAAKELLRRRRARASLIDFTKAVDIPGKPVSELESENDWIFHPVETDVAAHHFYILNVFEKVILGELPRAMIFLPPGSAKSTYGSSVAPVWGMGKFPGLKIILTSYGSDLARRHGRKARAIVKSDRFTSIFNTRLSSETSAADEWALTNGSEYLAGGILSGITGNRAHGLIIDDPIKGRQEADSDPVRESTWNAYQEDLRTRLVPGGWEFIIQTRWHLDDLAGRILPQEYNGETGLIRCRDGRDWFVVCLPAICDRKDDPLGRKIGECLWPEWFSEGHFAPFKRQPRTWAALFQQKPVPEDGIVFNMAWFNRYRTAPGSHEFRRIIFTCDTAFKEKEINDPSVIEVWGQTWDGRLYLLDLWRDRVSYPKLKKQFRNWQAKWSPHIVLIEDKASGQSLIQDLREPDDGYEPMPVLPVPVPPGQDKVIRAKDSTPLIESGFVYIPEAGGTEWLAEFESELQSFPVGKTKDQVDAMSQLLNWLRPKGYQMFEKGILDVAAKLPKPLFNYQLNMQTGAVITDPAGALNVWEEPGNGVTYVMGAMHQQTPFGESVINVIERHTGRQVAIWSMKNIPLEQFAVAIGWIGRRYNGAWAVPHREVEGETIILHLLKRYKRVFSEIPTEARTGKPGRTRAFGFAAIRNMGAIMEQLGVEIRSGTHGIVDAETMRELVGFRKEATGEVFIDLGFTSERALTRAMAGFVRQQLPATTLRTEVRIPVTQNPGNWGGRV